MDEFATAFGDADSLVLLDIYPASEAPIPGVTSQALAERITQNGPVELRTQRHSMKPLSLRASRRSLAT